MTSKILLTGAGFTHNFGLPLARHVWGMLFNDPTIQGAKKLRKKLLEDHDYESLYSRVLYDKKFSSEKEVFLGRINSVFNEELEDICKAAIQDEKSHGVSFSDLRNFINLFACNDNEENYLFTLNQDLFLERLFLLGEHKKTFLSPYIGNCLFNYESGQMQAQIGVNQRHSILVNHGGAYKWKNTEGIMLSNDELEEKKNNPNSKLVMNREDLLYYFKLHGSIGWRYKDNSKQIPLIMGRQKPDSINKEPLLKEYSDVFKQALSGKDSSLLTIGYSFSDKHINDVIAEAPDLKLHIINPQPLSDFKDKLENKIYNKIHGYYEATLKDLFPYSEQRVYSETSFLSETIKWQQLKSNFFNF